MNLSLKDFGIGRASKLVQCLSAVSERFRFDLCNSCRISYRRNITWSFGPGELQLISLRMASKDGVGDRSKTPSKIDKEYEEIWTSRQIEHRLRRKAMFKGAVTKNSEKKG